jgi:FkbM family methyltransferase
VSALSVQAPRRPLSRLLPRPLRALLRHPRVEPRVAAVLRATTVRESGRFAARELAGRRTEAVYRLRGCDLRALVQHGTADVHALDQAFYQRAHEPPPDAATVLAGADHPLRALDLGAHVGMWGLWLHARFPVAHVLALEPDPRNAARHRRQIELNGLRGSWEVLEAAAVTADGPVTFTVGQGTRGRVEPDEGGAAASGAGAESGAAAATGGAPESGAATATGGVPEPGAATVAGRDAFALLDDLDLLKLDIEWGEWALLADPRAAALHVPVVMLEYHATGAPLSDPGSGAPSADFGSGVLSAGHATGAPAADPGAGARRALERAGYTTAPPVETEPGFGVVWGWRAPCA